MAEHAWHIDDRGAELSLPNLSAKFDCHFPAKGLGSIGVGGSQAAIDGLFQVELPDVPASAPALFECYQRGGDLVVTYGETADHPRRAQVYLRSGSHPLASAHGAIELLASVQTSLLDDDPRIAVRSRLAAAAIWRLTAAANGAQPVWQRVSLQPGQDWTIDRHSGMAAFVLRLPGELSYAEFVHPLDFYRTTLTMHDPPGGSGWPQVQLRHELFARRLEKGVILRARALAVLLPRENDLAAALAHFQIFAASEPPLTT